MEPLGNLNKGCTVRTSRGLPFNAPCECTSMHHGSKLLFFNQSHFHTQITNSTRGWPLLGLPTLLTAGDREQGGVHIETQASKSFMHSCVCSNHAISPLIICNLTNLALYRLLALLQGSFAETRGKECTCCIGDEDRPVIYTYFIEVIFDF